jgi:hydroxymethylpyrimidine pyrophosphatase-like HAD family hydrolase
MAKGVSKGHTLAKLAEQRGYSRDEVIAIGDGLNDVEMVQWAGLGVAVANAVPELRDIADFVTTSCDEEGVAQVIDRFILQRG